METIKKHKENALQYLRETLESFGHFPVFDIYPNFAEKKDRGWHYMYRSPFIHASALDALLNAGIDKNDPLIKSAIQILLEFREQGDLWRYWNVNEAEFPTFSDVDQTSISSFALRKVGYQMNNKKLLYSRIKESGEVNTWINADFKIFKINPYVYFWLKYKNRKVMPILYHWKWITLDDHEPCIAANVLAYLGDNIKTIKLSEYIINGWVNDTEANYQHYDRKIILAYHIARAIKEGASSLLVLQESLIAFIQSDLSDFSFPELLMAYLVVEYLDSTHPLIETLTKIIQEELVIREAYKDHYGYTTEKKKEYFGGGGTLTAAWFLEVSKNW